MRVIAALLLISLPIVANAQECVISPDQLVGMLNRDGSCTGFKKDFAKKYLRIEQSQCAPAPKHGHLLLNDCVPDAPPLPKETEEPDDIQKLKAAVLDLQAQIGQLQTELGAQYLQLQSEIDFLKSELEGRREKR